MITGPAVIWGPRTCFPQARSAPPGIVEADNWLSLICFSFFPRASESYPGGCVLHCVEEIPVSEEPVLK